MGRNLRPRDGRDPPGLRVSSLTVRADPWRAYPSPDTTLAQLAPAVLEFELEVDVTTDLIVYLKRRDGDKNPTPTMEELGKAMFGEGHNAILVTETGAHRRLEESFDDEARDRHEEGV